MSLYMARVVVLDTDQSWMELHENPNAWKGLLWRIFSHLGLPENEGGYVFRETFKMDCVDFFVLSPHRPDVMAYGRRPIKVDMKEVGVGAFPCGSRFRFVSRFCPTRKSDGKRMKIMEEEVPAWLGKQMAGAATVQECVVVDRGYQEARKGEQIIGHSWVDVEGVLEVVDSGLFIDKLGSGVGRGKRYGFGLIVPRSRV